MNRATFPHKILPYLLLLPQLVITVVFFYWPAGQAIRQSLLREDAFGLKTQFVGLANFEHVLADPAYLNAIGVTVIFSVATAFISMAVALLLAVQAEKVVRGKTLYRTLLIWPYAVAPAIAGMLWLFLFNPSFGSLAYPLRLLGLNWDPLLKYIGFEISRGTPVFLGTPAAIGYERRKVFLNQMMAHAVATRQRVLMLDTLKRAYAIGLADAHKERTAFA